MRLVAQGFRRAKAVTRAHAKSFFFASYLLFGLRRRAAFALYAFCRRLDDMVDEGDEQDLPARLRAARQRVAEVYLTLPALASPALDSPAERLMSAEAQSPWDPGEFAALKYCIRHYRIPEQPFQDLISGMEMDLTQARYATWSELELYCYRVAGVVGLMLTPVLGCSSAEAAGPAADLGRAMQLTNILRDVREDLGRGRIYLPADELAAFGLSEADLARGQVDERWRCFMRFQIARARDYYARAAAGLPLLTGFGSQRMVRLMGTLYGDILRDIERRDCDVFSARAHTTGARKLALASRTLLLPALAPAPLSPPQLPSRSVP
jgi:15-cis-phytoene synthase